VLALGRIELRQGIERASKLEGAHALEILAFEEQLGAEFAIDRARGQHRGLVGVAFDALSGSDHVVIRRKHKRLHDYLSGIGG
jgi:hypothetical protein